MRISIGNSRKDIHWRVVDMSWPELCKKLSATTRTSETCAQYRSMSKDDKAMKKDIGGFVGGVISNGRRTKANIASRSLVTLDADYANLTQLDAAKMLCDYAWCCYSTHSHTTKAPRLRYVIPLNREVKPEEYEPIARKIAEFLGIEQFDVTTYEPTRLMYWPSTPSDGEFLFYEQEGELLNADGVLASYQDWKDSTTWPVASTESTVQIKQAKSQGQPELKPGIVGLFCRTYNVKEAIAEFLSDVYEPCDDPNRYTYIGGTTSAGVVIYNDEFAYSHHATDPAGGTLCNAFDLVRLHKFGAMDADVDPTTPITKMPSYKAMSVLAGDDPGVKKVLVGETAEAAKQAFGDLEPLEEEGDWTTKLRVSKQGAIEATIENLVLILENDPNIKGAFATNSFTARPCTVKSIPWKKCEDKANGSQWTDADDSGLRHYVETTYGIYNQGKLSDALATVMSRHAFHPVRKYLESLKWDGIKRAEHLFIHYLGAEDNLYTRTVTRKWLAAAVARVMRPGVKFDNLVVLVGSQGIGKSYLGSLLGKGWFSDTFVTVQGKDAYEQLKGSWIIEIGELSAMKKAEVESVKMFISKQEDNYRAAYGRFSQVNKRQCVFYGTTNDDSFLRDTTGNRRFWPIGVDKDNAIYDVFDLTPADVDQIWAEAVSWFKAGESLYLSPEVSALAVIEQNKYMMYDPRQGKVEEYLDTPIPENWESLDPSQRRNYIQGFLKIEDGTPTKRRDTISVVELAYELFGEETIQPWQAKEYHNILTGIKGWKKSGRRPKGIYGQQPSYERIE